MQGAGEPAARLHRVGHRASRPARVAAKGEELGRGRGVNEAAHKVARTVRVDGPRPAEVGVHIAVVLGQRDQFVGIGIGNVHEHKAAVEVAGQQGAEVPAFDAIDGHAVVASVVAGVDFERQLVFDGQLSAPRPAPVAQKQPARLVEFRALQQALEDALGVGVGALFPAQGAVVRVLGLDRYRMGAVLGEEGFHALLEASQAGDGHAGLSLQGRGVNLAVAKAGPRQVVEEKVHAGLVGRAGPRKVVGLHVVEPAYLAEQFVPPAGPTPSSELFLRLVQLVPAKIGHAIHVVRQDAHGLAVAGEADGRKGRADAVKARAQVWVRSVVELVQALARRTSGDQVGGDVVAKKVLQNVRAVFGPVALLAQVFVRIDKQRVGDVLAQVRGHGACSGLR